MLFPRTPKCRARNFLIMLKRCTRSKRRASQFFSSVILKEKKRKVNDQVDCSNATNYIKLTTNYISRSCKLRFFMWKKLNDKKLMRARNLVVQSLIYFSSLRALSRETSAKCYAQEKWIVVAVLLIRSSLRDAGTSRKLEEEPGKSNGLPEALTASSTMPLPIFADVLCQQEYDKYGTFLPFVQTFTILSAFWRLFSSTDVGSFAARGEGIITKKKKFNSSSDEQTFVRSRGRKPAETCKIRRLGLKPAESRVQGTEGGWEWIIKKRAGRTRRALWVSRYLPGSADFRFSRGVCIEGSFEDSR